MNEKFSRSVLLLGEDALNKLNKSKVAVFGVGGVGSFVVEALARTGVGELVLVDNDAVCQSNINRQLIALESTLGKPKVKVAERRILDINPAAKVSALQIFYDKSFDHSLLDSCDYVVDAIDTVTSKLLLAEECHKRGVRIISSMGAGNKLSPILFRIEDIYNTSVCPLCRIMRRELKKRGIEKLKVVYSTEPPLRPHASGERKVIGSVAFVPSCAGLIIASEVINDIISE